MKRKGLAFFLTALLALSLTACGAGETAAEPIAESAPQQEIEVVPLAQTIDAAAIPADVAEDAWYADAVLYVTENGLMDPLGSSFVPNADTPREIIAESLWRANGRKTVSAGVGFSDVTAANKAAIDWAVESGVVNGMGGGKFGTGLNVSRQDFAVMLWRAAGKPSASGNVSFGDAASIADYAKEAAAWTEENGIINGIDGNFAPQSNVTRAQVATILQRYLERQTNPVTTTPGGPTVYFTSDISAAGLVKVYEQLGWHPAGKAAVKVSTGEPPASNYLRADLIGDLVRSVNGTIVECNTAYGGSRATSAMHKQVAADHGFTSIADFDLMDEDGEVSWPVTGGKRLDHILVGSHAENYPDWLILSHYKGHAMAGFGGAIKNVGIGASSSSGKLLVHSAGTRTTGSIMYSDQDAWLEALAEMVDGFVDHVGTEHIVYVNVMNRLSVDCDCDGHPAEPDIHDIGILASTDPVALDQACYDLVSKAEGSEALMNRIERQHGLHTLEHAEKIGLGSRSYTLVNIDA
ncbi:MAG: DUF362 domain-containing protein [Clostridia bacterium]|nr:DUF362 domain-containing protein [Clostridia bacterium]